MIKFGKVSFGQYLTVTPKLRLVLDKAAELADPKTEDFSILEGVRGREKMMVNWGQGRTAKECAAHGIPAIYAHPQLPKVTWLNDPFNSPHKAGPDGLSRAVDLLPFPFVDADWKDNARFQRIRDLVFRAAAEVGVKIRWGRDWNSNGKYMEKGETDGPHFELV